MEVKDINHLRFKRLFFTVSDNFLCKEVNLDADINYCIQVPVNIDNSLNDFYTLVIDLKQSNEQIWAGIYHRTQDEINSFLNNQTFEYGFESNLSEKKLDYYLNLYDNFSKTKNIRKAERFRIEAYNTNGIFAASFIKQNEQLLCINFYRVTKQRATNLYTFHFNNNIKNEFSMSHLGRAHRALHWLDIKKFKELNVGYYDFCGWYDGNDDSGLLNINKFKEQFTSIKLHEYSGVIYKNWFLRLLKKLRSGKQ